MSADLEIFVITGVKPEAAILVADSAERPLTIHLILHLHRGVLGGGDIGREGDIQLAGCPLLHRDARARLLVSVTAKLRINGKLRDAGTLVIRLVTWPVTCDATRDSAPSVADCDGAALEASSVLPNASR